MIWKPGMIGRHKVKKSLYVVIGDVLINKTDGSGMEIVSSIPLEDYINKNKIMVNLLEPVSNLEPLGELQEILYA